MKALAPACLCLVLSGAAGAAPPTWLPPEGMALGNAVLQSEDLKEVYLECDRMASTTLLDSSTAALCSVVAQRLLVIGFDGRAEALLAWWRQAVDMRHAMALAQRAVSHRAGR